MCKRTIVAAVLVLLSPLGCSDEIELPEAAGRVVITFHDEELVLDTGNHGQTVVGLDPDAGWSTWCSVTDNVHYARLSYGGPRNFKGFNGVVVVAHGGEGALEGTADVAVFIDADVVNCASPYQATYESPSAWTISVAACDLASEFLGKSAHLDEASLRVKTCDDIR